MSILMLIIFNRIFIFFIFLFIFYFYFILFYFIFYFYLIYLLNRSIEMFIHIINGEVFRIYNIIYIIF